MQLHVVHHGVVMSSLMMSQGRAIAAMVLVGGATLASCASVPRAVMTESAMPGGAEQAMNQAVAPASAPVPAPVAEQAEAKSPRSQAQLVRTAELMITVNGVSQSIGQITTLVRQQGGEILHLQEQVPQEGDRRHTADVQFRVPQTALDATVKQLATVGTVQRQSLTAEDVSEQLVDGQARLRNLRRTEDTLLTIMKRSGSVGDVLKVAQELGNVRSSIEQMEAQLKDLQNRVAYSTVTVHLEAAIASTIPGRTTSAQLSEAWGGATHSLQQFTLLLLRLGIWLIVYSPYWFTVGALAIALYWKYRRPPSPPNTVDPQP